MTLGHTGGTIEYINGAEDGDPVTFFQGIPAAGTDVLTAVTTPTTGTWSSYALKATGPWPGQDDGRSFTLTTARGAIGISIAFRLKTGPASGKQLEMFKFIGNSGSRLGEVAIHNDGGTYKLAYWEGKLSTNPFDNFTERLVSQALSLDTWYRLNYLVMNNRPGTSSYYWSQQLVLSDNTGSELIRTPYVACYHALGPSTTITEFWLGLPAPPAVGKADSTTALEIFYDDIVMVSGGVHAPRLPKIKSILPTQEGGSTGFTASAGTKVACVNDRPPDTDDASADYVYRIGTGTISQTFRKGVAITNIAISAGGVSTITATAHGYANGDSVTILGSDSTASVDGTWAVSNVTANTFDITTAGVTVAGTTGTVYGFNVVLSGSERILALCPIIRRRNAAGTTPTMSCFLVGNAGSTSTQTKVGGTSGTSSYGSSFAIFPRGFTSGAMTLSTGGSALFPWLNDGTTEDNMNTIEWGIIKSGGNASTDVRMTQTILNILYGLAWDDTDPIDTGLTGRENCGVTSTRRTHDININN